MNFIYLGEANVSEEYLNNFHEIAEDLKVRGLCERNIDSYESNEEVSSKVPYKNTYSSEERKKTLNECVESDRVFQRNFNHEIDTKH